MRSLGLLSYMPSYNRIRSIVKLYRPTNTFMLANAGRDYGLNALVEAPVDVELFDGDHTTVLDNCQLHDAINKLIV